MKAAWKYFYDINISPHDKIFDRYMSRFKILKLQILPKLDTWLRTGNTDYFANGNLIQRLENSDVSRLKFQRNQKTRMNLLRKTQKKQKRWMKVWYLMLRILQLQWKKWKKTMILRYLIFRTLLFQVTNFSIQFWRFGESTECFLFSLLLFLVFVTLTRWT